MNEDRFILNAARINLSKENINVLKEISSNGIDWDSFGKKATRHGISTFIYYSLKKHDLIELVPKEIYEKFKAQYYSVAVQNSILLEEFNKLSKIISNKIIPLKGIDLIQRLYPNIAIRSMCDIDILVEKKHVWEIWHTLARKKLKCKPVYKSAVHGNHLYSKHLPHVYLENCKIDVHWNLFRGSRIYEIAKNACETSIFNKSNIYRLSNEMMLIHLCSHFYDHLQTCAILRMMCDINEFILKYQSSLDWKKIENICSDSKLKHDVDTALNYSHVLLKTPIPYAFVSEEIQNNPDITISTLVKGTHNIFERYFQRLKKVDNSLNMIIFIFRTFVPVNEWMADKYDVSTKGKQFKAYLQYWQNLINAHVLKKEAPIGN